ncbi:CoA transferase [Streptomyces heilongjiangensis]|uniref:CoA transferase n=1 Tax=Streptomyces heilongjiangensis TaxID=945052 RepID=A0ABW1BIM4_9ACTN|nr:CoA transferase [Streptomyces heilongjiangensis]MDC2951846.1 CoA transferase [Streptomyces heilongjiangensis]
MTRTGPLQGTAVLTAGHGRSAALLGRLLADLGARVVPLGWPPAHAGPFERWLHSAAELAAGWDRAPRLLETADVLVCDGEGDARLTALGLSPRELLERHPELVTVRLSGFGLTGPLRDTPATEATLQALAGLTAVTGTGREPPVTSVVGLASRTACLSGLIAVVAGLVGRERGGGGDYLDIAEFDSLLTLTGTLLPSVALAGRPPRSTGNRHGMAAPWNSYPCLDAPVVICTMGEPMWHRLAAATDRRDLTDNPRFADTAARVRNVDELDKILGEWTAARPAADVVTRLQASGIPCAQVAAPDEVRRGALARRRGLATGPSGAPGSPLRSLVPAAADTRLPRQGLLWERIPRGSLPLRGVRLLEIGSYTAGPHAGRLLAQLGADVLKVEPPHGEGSRRLAQQVGGVGYLYHVNNAGKRSCRLDLADARDRARFDQLLAGCDIVLTSLAADTLAAQGLAPEQILARHGVAHCTVTGHGLAAADRSVDTVIQAESGIMSLVGGQGAGLRTPVSSADVLGAYLAAAASVVSTYVRLRTGRGCAADVALFDSAVWTTQDRWYDDAPLPAPQLLKASDGIVLVDTQEPLPQPNGPVTAVLDAAAAAGVPAAPLYDLTRTVRHPQVHARRMVVAQDCADATVLVTGNHLRSLLRESPPLSCAPIDQNDPDWLPSAPIQGQR